MSDPVSETTSSLNTFGAILTYAIGLETRLHTYYAQAGNADLAAGAEARAGKLERVRRQNVVEITLEPIEGLSESDYTLNLDDLSVEGQRAATAVAARFYADCAPKINAREARRALERCGRDHAEAFGG